MKIAFCLFKYFPYGGLQRDFLRIAKACRERGHEIHVFTMAWEGNAELDMNLHLVKPRGWQNHTRILSYVEQVKLRLDAGNFDLVVGFNKMPHLDIYYAADVCYKARIKEQRGIFYRLLPRYKHYSALEKSVFAHGKKTEILLISPLQQSAFTHCYQTEVERFHLLPPGIAKDRIAPSNAQEIRAKIRSTYQLTKDHTLLLMVGSGFKTKGVDRAIRGLESLPTRLKHSTHLFVIGKDDPKPFKQLAADLNVAKQVHFLGGRDDVPDFLLAADFLIHPSYHENTGTALLEAVTAGLPVLTVDSCGYAHYINEAGAGMVLPTPYSQTEFNGALEEMLVFPKRSEWQENALKFARHADIYSLPEKAAAFIDQIGKTRVRA